MPFTNAFWKRVAAEENDEVKLILEDYQICNSVIGAGGTTLLHLVVNLNNSEITKYLLDKGANVNARDEDGDTPLITAVKMKCCKVLPILLSAGSNIDIEDEYGYDALHYALFLESPSPTILVPLFSALIQKHSSEKIAKQLIALNCPLELAVYSKDTKIIEHMIQSGVPVKCKNEFPLHVAVRMSDVEMVKLLLKYKVDVEEWDRHGCSPLYYFYSDSGTDQEKIEILEILMDNGVSLTSCNERGSFNLHLTLTNAGAEVIQVILKSEVDFTAKENWTGGTLLHCIAKNRNEGIVEVLQEHIKKLDVNVLGNFNNKPLSWAVVKGNVEMVEFFLRQGCEANTEALLNAYYCGPDEDLTPDLENQIDRCAEILLQQNLDPQGLFRKKNLHGITIIDAAIEKKRFDRVEFALAQLALREKQGIKISEVTDSKVNSNTMLKAYFSECQRLLDKKITGFKSIFELLSDDSRKMAKYLNNKKFDRELRQVVDGNVLMPVFKYYHRILKNRFNKGTLMKTYRDNAAVIISKISGGRINSRHIATEMILDQLNMEDLRQLIIVTFIKPSFIIYPTNYPRFQYT